ncbi:MAG: Trm112 family protein [Acidobacteriales bacterium]|nr:Trm112 family protein [Terriglobales bacterium]
MDWKELIDRLVCPACRQPLAIKASGDALKCDACKRVYPVRDDIPILLIDQATIED